MLNQGLGGVPEEVCRLKWRQKVRFANSSALPKVPYGRWANVQGSVMKRDAFRQSVSAFGGVSRCRGGTPLKSRPGNASVHGRQHGEPNRIYVGPDQELEVN